MINPVNKQGEGLRTARLLMVFSSISPLFIVWAIRGNNLIKDHYFIGICLMLIIFPNLFLWLRIKIAIKREDKRELSVGKADDHRDHILVYLFTMLLPFYTIDLGNLRNLFSALAALGVITDLKLPEITDLVFPLNLYTKGFTPARVWSTKLNTRQGEPSEQGEEYAIGKNLARTRCETT